MNTIFTESLLVVRFLVAPPYDFGICQALPLAYDLRALEGVMESASSAAKDLHVTASRPCSYPR